MDKVNKGHVCNDECRNLKPVGSKYMYVWWMSPNGLHLEYAKLDRFIVTDHCLSKTPFGRITYLEEITPDPKYKDRTVYRDFWPIVKGRVVEDWKLAVGLGLQPHPFPGYEHL